MSISEYRVTMFSPDPSNPYTTWSTDELERARASWATSHAEQFDRPGAVRKASHVGEELSRREDVDKAVELWERLCAVPFVRGETQGYYTHSTCHLSPEVKGTSYIGGASRMPDTAELEALILSDGEETAYPVHDVETRPFILEPVGTNPWSGDDRLYPITLTLISCGDYHGSDLDAANNRALDGTPGVTVREPNTGGMGSVFNISTTVVGEMSSFENSQTTADWEREPAQRRADALEWLESLVQQMEGLTDYPVLDDETHSELIDELAGEAWDSWLKSDMLSDLAKLSPEEDWDLYDTELTEDAVREAYYAFEGNDWVVESLGSGAVNGRHDDAVKHVARTVCGWSV